MERLILGVCCRRTVQRYVGEEGLELVGVRDMATQPHVVTVAVELPGPAHVRLLSLEGVMPQAQLLSQALQNRFELSSKRLCVAGRNRGRRPRLRHFRVRLAELVVVDADSVPGLTHLPIRAFLLVPKHGRETQQTRVKVRVRERTRETKESLDPMPIEFRLTATHQPSRVQELLVLCNHCFVHRHPFRLLADSYYATVSQSGGESRGARIKNSYDEKESLVESVR